MDAALTPVADALFDEAKADEQAARARWEKYISPAFQQELERMDELARWGRALKPGTVAWQEHVLWMLDE